VVAIAPDSPSDGRRLTADLGLPFPVLSDRELRVAAALGVAADGDIAPAAFLIDGNGALRWSFVGRHPLDQPSPQAALAVLIGPRPLAVPGPSRFLTPAVAAAAGVLLALLAILAATADGRLLAWDVPTRDAIRGVDAPWFASLMRTASQLGSRWLIAVLMVPMVAVAWRRCRQLAAVVILALPAGLGVELVLKALVDRPRPAFGSGFGSSFPSGHVLAAAAFWGLVPPWTLIVTRRRWVWAAATGLSVAIVAAVGLSRVYVGAHWPSDVVAGYLAGSIFLLAAEWAVRRPSRILRCASCDLHRPPASRRRRRE